MLIVVGLTLFVLMIGLLVLGFFRYPREYHILANMIPTLVFPTPGGPYKIVFNILPLFSPLLVASINLITCKAIESFNLAIPTR